MLVDVNVQGYLAYLQRLWDHLDLAPFLFDLKLEFVTFADVGFPLDLDDRMLWKRCQADGWVLFTENRNHDGQDSLTATLGDSWQPGPLPVITLANKARFAHDRIYAAQVAADAADVLFSIRLNQLSSVPRIFVPLQ